ncbi:hypothetical protein FZEAL_7557 [Fusarium zealandicum]|uniref:Thiolase-like protein type 1 additional C-terminal domain-containing protein n=1 Tax=Fusarium zealandicum TaxID=1053134 RepID=A0A8H4UGD0_9HYPO|nr:hypothetical protein FZEAL_7557 [Fusarium zealandicum]
MALSPLTPIIVGIGEVRQKEFTLENTLEPAELILSAIREASKDSSADIIEHIDSLSVVPPWSWNYSDLPGLLAEKLGIEPSHRILASHGGNTPALLCDESAARVAAGDAKVAVVAGGEALASLFACQKAGRMPPSGWTKQKSDDKVYSPSDYSLVENVGAFHSVGLPIQVYPLYENALRQHKHQTLEENHQESAELYAKFDKIACHHRNSWRAGETPRDAKTIGAVREKNRMICTPYPLLMNAFNGVNLAAACIVTSIEYATELGIPQDKWVYVLGGAGANDSTNFWQRTNYFSSPAIEYSIDKTLESAGLAKDEMDCFDFYSCFPIVPKIACKHLELDMGNPGKPITLLGGLTSFGGAGNNYSLHAIVEMTRKIRDKTHQTGLVLANGGVLSWQHAICLSAQPRRDHSPYSRQELLGQSRGASGPIFVDQAKGEALIETYTVDFDRSGPKLGHIVGRLEKTGYRFIANHGNEFTLATLASGSLEPIGMRGVVEVAADGRNLFIISPSTKL